MRFSPAGRRSSPVACRARPTPTPRRPRPASSSSLRERLLLVTDVEVAGGVETMVERLTSALAAVPPGSVLVELRDKQRSDRDQLAARVGTICRAAGTRWV